jgi:hypothetical protein
MGGRNKFSKIKPTQMEQAARERGTDLYEIHQALMQNGKELEIALSDLIMIVNKLQEAGPEPSSLNKTPTELRYSEKLNAGVVRDLYACAEGGALQVKTLINLISKLSKIV